MIRPFGLGMPSDAIAHRYGFDGNEPAEVAALLRQYNHLGLRSTFAINTFYSEVQGAHYENRAVLQLVDRALRLTGLLPVILDCYRDTGLVPIEGEGQLLVDEQYALIGSDQQLSGLLLIWKFYAGGGGPYYGDNIIFDVTMSRGLMEQLVNEVEGKCLAHHIRFAREASVSVGT